MQFRTRVMAWTYIIVQIPLMLRALYLGLVASGLLAGIVKVGHPAPKWIATYAGLGMLRLSLILLAFVLFHLIPWIYLLKERAWAWWMITFEYAAVAVMGALQLMGQHALNLGVLSGTPSGKTAVLVVPLSTVIILLLDRPSGWSKKTAATD